jgi:hypothetical protein
MSDLANKTKEGPPTKEGSKLVHHRPTRAELVWEGKYDAAGRRVAPLRVALPFQTVETVNESAQDRQKGFQFGSGFREEAWRNRLIWGDKKYVLPALLPEFAGKVNLIYIDPPFDTGADFRSRRQCRKSRIRRTIKHFVLLKSPALSNTRLIVTRGAAASILTCNGSTKQSCYSTSCSTKPAVSTFILIGM